MPDFKLSEFLPYRVAILSASMSGLIAQEYESRFGLTMNQWRIIVILAEHGKLSANDISGLTLMDKMTISRALKKLTARNLVHRRLSETDSRKTIITLSDTGRSIHAEILPLAKQYENELETCLTDEESKQFSELLSRIQDKVSGLRGMNNRVQKIK